MYDVCEDIATFGKGIGNTCRYKILEALLESPKSVGELVEIVGQPQPTVSQHLKTLKLCKMVRDERNGKEIIYTIIPEYTKFLKDLGKVFKEQ